jgi:hypothetical protein
MSEHLQQANKAIALNVKLSPMDHSDQPISANYTKMMVAQGIAYLDFGFIEPSAVAMVAQAAKNGKPVPNVLEGKLRMRVSMSIDALQRLQQQLQQVLVGLRGTKGDKL